MDVVGAHLALSRLAFESRSLSTIEIERAVVRVEVLLDQLDRNLSERRLRAAEVHLPFPATASAATSTASAAQSSSSESRPTRESPPTDEVVRKKNRMRSAINAWRLRADVDFLTEASRDLLPLLT